MRKMIILLIVFVILLSCGPGQAFADVSINNQIKDGEGNPVISGSSAGQNDGYSLILSTGDQYSITMPNRYAYFQPVSMYIDAPGDHSIYVYRELDCDKEKLMPFAYEGMRVTAVAEQKNGDTYLTCIVYRDENYRLRAGWVHSKYLTGWFPGAVQTIGRNYTGTVYTAGDPVLSWARDYFVNTKQKYTVLVNPIRACTRFSLNYQVTDRGGVQTQEVLGPRTIYVNDGSGWVRVGQFEYSKIQSVLVTVNLTESTDLLAVAVIPSCSKPDRFTFRQSVQDVLTLYETASANGNDSADGYAFADGYAYVEGYAFSEGTTFADQFAFSSENDWTQEAGASEITWDTVSDPGPNTVTIDAHTDTQSNTATFDAQPSSGPSTVTIDAQPSPGPNTVMTDAQPSPEPSTVTIDAQPSPGPSTVMIDAQPSPGPNTVMTDAQPSPEPSTVTIDAHTDAQPTTITVDAYTDPAANTIIVDARPDNQPDTIIVNAIPDERNINIGSAVTFGTYEQDNYSVGSREPIEWIVLEKKEDRLLLISRYALDCISYCSRQDSGDWETSKVRAWLNDQFLAAAFTEEEQRAILFTDVDNGKSQGYIHYEGDGGNNTQDQVFLLSYAEAWKYFFDSSDRACKPTKAAIRRGAFESPLSGNCPWWLRSPGYSTDYIAAVDVDGNRGGNVKYGTMAIRPAMWVESSAILPLGYYNYIIP